MRHALNCILAVCAVSLATVPAFAFHSGGVGECLGCHTSFGGLNSASATDVCLRCHETGSGNTWGVTTTDIGPVWGGGAFIPLRSSNLQDQAGGLPISGDKAGHNVLAFLRGTNADFENTVAPGGTYLSAYLQCTSCHDPHGKGGHFRLLYGSDSPPSQAAGYTYVFTQPAPTATGLDVDGPPESKGNHTSYNAGMSAWCGNCHGV